MTETAPVDDQWLRESQLDDWVAHLQLDRPLLVHSKWIPGTNDADGLGEIWLMSAVLTDSGWHFSEPWAVYVRADGRDSQGQEVLRRLSSQTKVERPPNQQAMAGLERRVLQLERAQARMIGLLETLVDIVKILKQRELK